MLDDSTYYGYYFNVVLRLKILNVSFKIMKRIVLAVQSKFWEHSCTLHVYRRLQQYCISK